MGDIPAYGAVFTYFFLDRLYLTEVAFSLLTAFLVLNSVGLIWAGRARYQAVLVPIVVYVLKAMTSNAWLTLIDPLVRNRVVYGEGIPPGMPVGLLQPGQYTLITTPSTYQVLAVVASWGVVLIWVLVLVTASVDSLFEEESRIYLGGGHAS